MSNPVEPEALAQLPLDDLVACHECDLLMRKPQLQHDEKAQCPRCGYELYAHRHNLVNRSLALVLTALLLYVPANFLPIMQLHLLGQTSDDTVWSGVLGLYNSEMRGIAVVVFLCSMAIPLLKLLCQLAVLLSIRLDIGRSYGLLIYRIYHHLREWGMLEVYFMGVLVAIVKLVDLAELSIGLGLVCFVSLLLVQVWLEVVMSPHQIWVALSGRMSMRAIDAGILVCNECHELNRQEADSTSQTCTRCGATVHARRPNSIVRTWALLITAMILYIPANVLPIMTVSALGQGSPDTIMSGVITLMKHGMLPIAAVVFIASILVPTFKLVGIALLLYSVQRHQPLSARQRILMYRFIEFIGRWSMLDIFVIAILVAVVNFGRIASVEANLGAVAFASVVILTMLAALTFDPRLIWDNTESDDDHE